MVRRLQLRVTLQLHRMSKLTGGCDRIRTYSAKATGLQPVSTLQLRRTPIKIVPHICQTCELCKSLFREVCGPLFGAGTWINMCIIPHCLAGKEGFEPPIIFRSRINSPLQYHSAHLPIILWWTISKTDYHH